MLYYLGGGGAICGYKNIPLKSEGKGFYEGERVTVIADLKTGKVTWEVDGTFKTSFIWDKLKNASINWAPYIVLYNRGDVLEILE